MISTGVLALRDKYKLIKYLVTGASALVKRGIPFDHSLLHPERPEVQLKQFYSLYNVYFPLLCIISTGEENFPMPKLSQEKQ